MKLKTHFLQFKTAFIYQIVLWVFPVVLSAFLAVFLQDKTKDDWQGILIIFVVSELLLNIPVVLTLQRVVFSENDLLVKLGWFTLQRIPYREIQNVCLFRRQSGQITVNYYFFASSDMNAEEVNKYWKKGRLHNRQIIFCESGQKGLKKTISAFFPQQFDPDRVLHYPAE